MYLIPFTCPQCRKPAYKPVSAVNRARAAEAPIYCGRVCAGLARRKPEKTKAQKVAEKAAYDAEYRIKNKEMLRAKRAAYFQRTYDPEAARIERKKRAAFHAEYCRQPSYKLWKAEYDRRRRAQAFGEFADAYTLTLELNREIKARSSNYEIRRQNQTGNKAQERDRRSPGPKRDDSHSASHGQ
jgi:hypothetical protein